MCHLFRLPDRGPQAPYPIPDLRLRYARCFCRANTLRRSFNEYQDKAAGTGVVPMLFLFYTFYDLAFNALLYSYPVERLPFPIHAKAFSALMFFGKGGNFINALVNPIGLVAMGWKYYIVCVGWSGFEVVAMYCLLIETKGPSLEAIAARIDKKNVIIDEEDGIPSLSK